MPLWALLVRRFDAYLHRSGSGYLRTRVRTGGVEGLRPEITSPLPVANSDGDAVGAEGAPTQFSCEIYALKKEEGGRHTPIQSGYRPQARPVRVVNCGAAGQP
jgi:hypothetical protein